MSLAVISHSRINPVSLKFRLDLVPRSCWLEAILQNPVIKSRRLEAADAVDHGDDFQLPSADQSEPRTPDTTEQKRPARTLHLKRKTKGHAMNGEDLPKRQKARTSLSLSEQMHQSISQMWQRLTKPKPSLNPSTPKPKKKRNVKIVNGRHLKPKSRQARVAKSKPSGIKQ
jgi:hypothetical protein